MERTTINTDCSHFGCERSGFWIETAKDGTKRLCFRVRHDGQIHEQKLSEAHIATIFRNDQLRRAI